jgi:hypothetical protein
VRPQNAADVRNGSALVRTGQAWRLGSGTGRKLIRERGIKQEHLPGISYCPLVGRLSRPVVFGAASITISVMHLGESCGAAGYHLQVCGDKLGAHAACRLRQPCQHSPDRHPMRRLDATKSWHDRALQIYLVLIGAAEHRRTMSYGELDRRIGYGGANLLKGPLDHIHFWCEENEIPVLSALVVGKGSGVPGAGYPSSSDVRRTHEQVFAFDWCSIMPPTPEDLRAAWQARRSR